MKSFIFYTLALIVLLSTKSLSLKRERYVDYQLSLEKSESFKRKINKELYESFVLGDKKNLSYGVQEKFKKLGVIHIMTPSGLHYGVTLFLLLFFLNRFKINKKIIILIQIYIGVIIYSYINGLFAFRRYALLFSTKLFNQVFLGKYFSSIQIVLIVFLFDFFFGTKSYSPLSYALSFFFIGIFSLQTSKPKFSLYYHLFIGQCIVAYVFNNQISISNIILSPIYTGFFSLLYPLLSLNLVFINSFNYSELIIEVLILVLNLFYKAASFTGFFHLNLAHLMILIILNRKNMLLFFVIFFLFSNSSLLL